MANRVRYICAGCGASVDPLEQLPFRCPNANGDDVDHVMVSTPQLEGIRFPERDHENPYVAYRALLPSYRMALDRGMSDRDFIARVLAIDERIASVDGGGFTCTPLTSAEAMRPALLPQGGGSLWIKNETENVAGSHKARHLMEVALYLDVMEQLDPAQRDLHDQRGLAIASCGNAALAASVLARAVERPLTVFVPTDAPKSVLARMDELGARISECPRRPGESGDPTVHAFRRARAAGAIPFCCQGNENGMNLDGGRTLAYEIVSELQSRGHGVDRIFIQVGGGALATSCIRALRESVALGILPRMPAVHAVQTANVSPLPRAYARVRALVLERMGHESALPASSTEHDAELAARMANPDARVHVCEALRYSQTHRGEFMWPWEQPPESVARSILDDETYDWHAVVTGMIESGGYPITVSEERLASANATAREAFGIPVDATGTAGLAGMMEWQSALDHADGGTGIVLFTGHEREVD